MRTRRSRGGPFVEQPFYADAEIERICSEELRSADLYPKTPEPIRIERFIEKRFRVRVEYEDLPPGVLGYTRFGKSGVLGVVISRALADDGTTVSERRLNTTLAHEAGHGLLHGHLFVLEDGTGSLFGDALSGGPNRILCRDDAMPSQANARRKRYDGRWWEVQANKAIGALLMPRPLVERAIDGLVEYGAGLGVPTLPPTLSEEAVRRLTAVFEVNPAVARIRVDGMFPESGAQLAL